ncbi:MAG: DUF1993 domain-containing protein [Rhodospirillaceae bacterium]
MTLSMYDVSVPLFVQTLTGLSGVLDKAAAHYDANGLDFATLVEARFAPDMFTFAEQIQRVCHHSTLAVSRFAQVDQPDVAGAKDSLAGFRAQIATALDFMGSVTPEQFAGSEERRAEFQVRVGPIAFSGRDMLIHFSIPQVMFHATTAYDLIRHAGVEVGKQDFLADAFSRRLT